MEEEAGGYIVGGGRKILEEEAGGYIVGGRRKILEADGYIVGGGRYHILFITELYYIICISVYISLCTTIHTIVYSSILQCSV